MNNTMTKGEIAKKIALRFFEILCDDGVDGDRALAEIWNTINPDETECWTELRGYFIRVDGD